MSKLTDLKDSVLDSAAKARGQWTPDPDSRHYQLYLDFHKRKRIRVPKRGRCEYFHKVIRQAFYEARWVFLGLLIALAVGGLVLLVLTHPIDMLIVAAVVLIVAYLACATFVSAHIGGKFIPALDDDSPAIMYNTFDKLPLLARILIGVLAIPGAVMLAILALVMVTFIGLAKVVGLLADAVYRPARWFFFEQPFGKRGFIWIRPWMITAFVAVLAVCVFVPGFFQAVYLPALIVVGVVAVALGVLYLAFLIDTHNRARKAARETSYSAELTAYVANGAVRQLFAFQHPEWVTDGTPDVNHFNEWLAGYDASCNEKHGKSYDQLDFWIHMEYIDTNEYFARFGEYLAGLESRLHDEFTGSHPHPHTTKQRHWYHVVVELMAVVWAGLRFAKQRVCPIVIYPPGDESA